MPGRSGISLATLSWIVQGMRSRVIATDAAVGNSKVLALEFLSKRHPVQLIMSY